MSAVGETGRQRDLAGQLEAHAAEFEARFGAGPGVRLFFAPGRVNLMGAHLDYSGGPVMPAAVDRGTFVALRRRIDRRIRLASTLEETTVDLELDDDVRGLARRGSWSDYPLGVVRELLARGFGDRDPCGVEVLYGGDLPIGAGLSSSASICVATAVGLDAAWELGLRPADHVALALAAERGFVGVQCGIMDPFAVGLARPGHVLWLDCKDESYEHIPLASDRLSIAVVDSGVRRELAHVAFNERVAQCASAFTTLRRHDPEATCLRDVRPEVFEAHADELEDVVARRVQHVLGELQRTFAAREALLAGDPDGFGRAMFEAHDSLRDLYEVSVPELDHIVATARKCDGVHGARLTGAGFGGCAVMLVARGAEEPVRERVQAAFRDRFGRDPAVEYYRGAGGPFEATRPS